MLKVSINILTKDRAEKLRAALGSVAKQSFTDYEVVVVDDGSRDNTQEILNSQFSISNQFSNFKSQVIIHKQSVGITKSRQEALEASKGEYVAILDDDDQWSDNDKLLKQVKFLDEHREYVLVGGGVRIFNSQFSISNKFSNPNFQNSNTPSLIPPLIKGGIGGVKHRPASDSAIRSTMLFRNNFFTSTVMFRRKAAIKAGGFIKDEIDLAEDYDLWLRMGKLGKMHNFREAFTQYSRPSYNKEKYKTFLRKQRHLIKRHKKDYPWHFLASLILKIRFGV